MAENDGKKSNVGLCKNSSMMFSTDDCPAFLPAAGNRNGTEVNNSGSNGNYWSASLCDGCSYNAYYLYFYSYSHGWNKYYYRYYGFSVRPVSELAPWECREPLYYRLTPEQLLADLYRAYKDARKHKRRKKYQLEFELNFEEELVKLCDELISRCYKPGPSACFIINEPKKREVFAADFRDRIVHHLYYNYTYELFDRTFIEDSYSCRKGKGTHYGFKRMQHHIRSVSNNYTRACYIMKIDVMGYFMHINRERLLGICYETFNKMMSRNSTKEGKRWCEILDFDFLWFLSRMIIMNNPLKECRIRGSYTDWKGLPRSKSLFYSDKGCGLPIGNLTSQLFSNVYMNVFDSFVVRKMPQFAYGRYVDDSYLVSSSKKALRAVVARLDEFLKSKLSLEVHPNKVIIRNAKYGMEFLGGYSKPYRCYIATKSLCRMKRKVAALGGMDDIFRLRAAVNSYLGVLSHYSTYKIRKNLFAGVSQLCVSGFFNTEFLKYILYLNKEGATSACARTARSGRSV